jgi:outer membrane protein assembly factor BamD (BamD/ComL family)
MSLIIILRMATKIKYTQKELKGPDKFSSTVIAGFEYFSDHSKKIVLIVVTVIVVLVAAYLVQGHRENKDDAANTVFNSAVVQLNAGNDQEALNGFNALRNEFPDNKITKIAVYYAGIINFGLGNYDESVNDLNQFLNSGVEEDMLVQSALLTQGLARFEQEKWQQAVELLSQFEKIPEGPLHERARIHLALAYEKLGQPQKAEAVYKELYKRPDGINPGMSPVNVNPSSGK